MGHSGGGPSRSANWVPHVTQTNRSMAANPTRGSCGPPTEGPGPDARSLARAARSRRRARYGSRSAGLVELAAEVSHIDAQRVGLGTELVAPDAVADEAAPQHRARVAHEQREE